MRRAFGPRADPDRQPGPNGRRARGRVTVCDHGCTTGNRLQPEDRAHVAQITDPGLRETVVASLLRHRSPESLRAGDPAPDVSLVDTDRKTLALHTLLGMRPVLLVFGSYT